MHVTAIIAAGGRGRRFGAPVPKQLIAVADRPILERSVRLFLTHPEVHEIVVALPADMASDPPSYLMGAPKPILIVEGGARRQDSVARAFKAISTETDLIVIHDAARPFASADLVSRTIAAAIESGAALAALQAHDTVKRVRTASGEPSKALPHDRGPFVAETLPRESIYLAQTPQAFRRDVLAQALLHGEQGSDATDEASLAERAGFVVKIVAGEPSNLKVTTPDDFLRAEEIARRVPAPVRSGRAGTGYDLHRLVPGRPLTVGGIVVPSEVGPHAHSDGDVVCHAVIDAILGAAGLGDIGRHFPDTDPRWKNVSSLSLVERAAAMLEEAGFEVGNVDVTVVLERPKLRDHIDAMRRAVGGALHLDPGRVSIKGKTNEGVDAVGRGEAIAAHAIALIRSRSRY
jgi:2-C-methyl-D-erythritol 4-phosphate cytidylyltransferase/2-C-methyl-D-erythritol 2,4-cyclodiphosphate synthase